MSLQKCHCGWSRVTTYRGLRIHQGGIGCMPKGKNIQQVDQSFWRNRVEGVDQGEHQPAKTGAVNKQSNFEAEMLEIGNVFSDVMRVAEDAEPKSLDRPFSMRTPTSPKLAATEFERISSFAVDVELDPTTAYKCLVSADGKRLSSRGGTQRFGSVLGLNRMTSGKSYWEVVVSNKTGWSLGVATGDAQRKGKLVMCPDNGYWVAEHHKNKFAALTNPPVGLPLKEKPQKVGVFVDYEEGLVSFYDATAQSHIYSFTECAFTEGIYPYFIVHVVKDGSADSLIISTVKHQ